MQVLLDQLSKTGFANVRFAQWLILALGSAAVPELSRNVDHSMSVALLGALRSRAAPAVPSLIQALW